MVPSTFDRLDFGLVVLCLCDPALSLSVNIFVISHFLHGLTYKLTTSVLCFSVTVESTVQQCIYLVVYHILLIMLTWSYWRTIFTDIEPIPDKVTV